MNCEKNRPVPQVNGRELETRKTFFLSRLTTGTGETSRNTTVHRFIKHLVVL